ncbi:hypothetical protein ACJD0Z_01120 [Flavobacteriaceae bacterium M23B6Z8]
MESTSLNQSNCRHCSAFVQLDERFCAECGYPENGTDKERSHFIAKKVMNKRKGDLENKRIKSGRNLLFILSALIFLIGTFTAYMANGDLSIFVENTILALIYFGLGLWSSKKPFISLLLALLLYLTITLINAIVDPSTLIRGIIFKGIVIAFLGKALYAAFEQKKNDPPAS